MDAKDFSDPWMRTDRPLAKDELAADFLVEGKGPVPFDQLANDFAEEIKTMVSAAGSEKYYRPMALCSPWGSGKTSFIMRVRDKLHAEHTDGFDCRTIYFDPWLFSGREELVSQFFLELASNLGKLEKAKEIAKDVLAFGLNILNGVSKVVSKTVGDIGDIEQGLDWSLLVPFPFLNAKTAIKGASSAIEELSSSALSKLKEGKSLTERKDEISNALKEESLPPIVVFIDNVDRLTDNEIRDLFRFVNAVVDFPGVLYVMSFDHGIVEHALEGMQRDTSSESYLDKIVSFRLDLPQLAVSDILRSSIGDIAEFSWLREAEADEARTALGNLLGTSRGVRKLCANYHGASVLATSSLFENGSWGMLLSVCARDLYPKFYRALKSHRSDDVQNLIDDVWNYPSLVDDGRSAQDDDIKSQHINEQDIKDNRVDERSGRASVSERPIVIVETFLGLVDDWSISSDMFSAWLQSFDSGKLESISSRSYLSGPFAEEMGCWLILRLVTAGRFAESTVEERIRAVPSSDNDSPSGDGDASRPDVKGSQVKGVSFSGDVFSMLGDWML